MDKKKTTKGSKFSNFRASRNKSKRKPLNRYLLETDSTNVSTSAKKLKMSKETLDVDVIGSFGYRFINFLPMFTMLSQLVVCRKCGSNIRFDETSKRGLGFKLAVICETCAPTYIDSSPLINNHAYDINRRIILAMRLLGIGLHGIIKFCAFMELPRPIFHSYYDKLVSNIFIAAEAVFKKSTIHAVAEEKKNERRKRYD